MSEQGPALDLAVRLDIEGHRRSFWTRAPGLRPLALAHRKARGLERRPQGLPLAVIDLGNGIELGHWPRWAGLWICPRIPSGLEGREAHLMAHHMVRMRIETARRFGDNYAGAQPAYKPHEPAGRFTWVGLDERIPVLIGGRPWHPRIPVAEQPQLRDPEQGTGLTQLSFPNGA